MSTFRTKLLTNWRGKLLSLGFFTLSFVYLEVLLHLFTYRSLSGRIVYPILFALVSGTVLYLISSLLPRKANRIIGLCAIILMVVYFEVQLVYHGIFGSFMPISNVIYGADAVTNFTSQIFYGIWQNIIPFLLFLLPIPVAALGFFRGPLKMERLNWAQALACCLLISVCTIGTWGVMRLCGNAPGSAYWFLVSPNTSTEGSIKNVGLAITTLQEARGMLSGSGKVNYFVSDLNGSASEMVGNESMYNVANLDFVSLMEKGGNEQQTALDRYFSTIAATKKNEYTGLAEGYNLIMLCCESFSRYLIDPVLTPTLYKLSTNGFVFNNFYCSFPNVTTNGEYAFCMGLLPDMTRTKTASTFDEASDNYLPYAMGNVFSSMGARAFAYHNYYGTFYDRDVSHANMGYDFKAIGSGLEIPVDWPSSDKDMIEASLDDLLAEDSQFVAYYMTFSGHYQYNWDNAMSAKNRSAVEDLPYSDTVKAYWACNLELEYALSLLMDRLEEAGVADRTVICLTADHYPYGLSEEEYNELAGEKVDTTFGKYHSSFICYVPNIEPVVVDDYCSSIDILPTLLNLFGINYDSRLLAGRDVLADCTHVAILADRSYLTDTFRYDAATGKAESYDGSPVNSQIVQAYCDYVANLFSISTEILQTDYYAHVFDGKAVNYSGYMSFTDVKNVFMESGVLFVSQNGYMLPDSQSVFGIDRNADIGECLNAFYQIDGTPAVGQDAALAADTPYRDAVLWAKEVGLIEDYDQASQSLSYEWMSLLMARYGYLRCSSFDIGMDEQELQQAKADYPNLTEESLRAMFWSKDVGIINGVQDGPLYPSADMTINRGQLAAFLQRFYFKYIFGPNQ